jgi:hypothetical protein
MVVKKKTSKKPAKPVKKEKPKTKPKEKSENKLVSPLSRESSAIETSVSPGRVTTKLCNVRIDYVKLKKPEKNNFGKYQYGLRIGFFGEILSYLHDPLVEAINTGTPKKWSEDKSGNAKWITLDEKEVKRLRLTAIEKVEDGMFKEGTDHFAEAYVFNANAAAEQVSANSFKPKSPIFIVPNVDKLYAGCWADVSVTFSLHANDGGGMAVYLNGIRFVTDDTNLSGYTPTNMWDEEAEEIGEGFVSEDEESDEPTGDDGSEEPETEQDEPKAKDEKPKKGRFNFFQKD